MGRRFEAGRSIVASGQASREIHRASECALQGLLRPIASLGEAKLVSPREFQKVNQLIFCVLAKTNSRGEFHEAAYHEAAYHETAEASLQEEFIGLSVRASFLQGCPDKKMHHRPDRTGSRRANRDASHAGDAESIVIIRLTDCID